MASRRLHRDPADDGRRRARKSVTLRSASIVRSICSALSSSVASRKAKGRIDWGRNTWAKEGARHLARHPCSSTVARRRPACPGRWSQSEAGKPQLLPPRDGRWLRRGRQAREKPRPACRRPRAVGLARLQCVPDECGPSE